MSPYRSLLVTADLLGRYRHVELEAFALVGERAVGAAEDPAALALAGAARAHAWRAVELERRLPVSLGLPGVLESTRSPGSEIDQAFAVLGANDDPLALLGTLADVLYPMMAEGYRTHLGSLDPLADPPVELALGRVLADLEATRTTLARRWSHAREAGDLSATLRALLSAAGGPFGRIL